MSTPSLTIKRDKKVGADFVHFTLIVAGEKRLYRIYPTFPIDKLKEYKRNPRNNQNAVDPVAESMRLFGFNNFIVARPDFQICAGHTRVTAATQNGDTAVPVMIPESLSEQQFMAYNVVDNKTAELATWLDDDLGLILSDLRKAGIDGAEIGFSDLELSELLSDLEQNGADPGTGVDPNDVPDVPKKARSKAGDVYILGNHRLVCGDSRERDVWTKLMDGKLASWMWTDPPYGVNYTGKTKKKLKIKNDTVDVLKDIVSRSFSNATANLVPGAPIYVSHPSGPLSVFFGTEFMEAGWHLHQTLCWCKSSMVLGHSDYHYQHEPILYGWTKGKTRPWYGERTQVSVFHVPKPSRSEEHPTMKPIELVSACLANSAKRGDIGIDPFSGSGSTMITSEQLGLRCFAIDEDPIYCDVIVDRWEKFTGRKAERIRRGKKN